ncbi:D-2-hydroxyacid dehydrogenase [Ottowia thiooxydans]|uniref:D-2-hydroxyacid dehydrogenase n=1 Tax=Ottowia thiooxydans TaxID=219182 RepID=UPI000561D0EA|nr:D-2-hydroxyacid dehydrogenase [Ottowia thiooxydans]
MERSIRVALPGIHKELLESKLPSWLSPSWFYSFDDGLEAVRDAEIGWVDLPDKKDMSALVHQSSGLRWVNTVLVGMDGLPVDLMAQRNITLTNGAGLNSVAVAEFIVLSMLVVAKGYDQIAHARTTATWLTQAPGRLELSGTKALIIGYGSIGRAVESRLQAFGVSVTVVRRSPSNELHVLGPGQWQEKLPNFDWVILTVPATAETVKMFGVAEFRAMKSTAFFLNFSRGSLVDQPALVHALAQKSIGGAFLDVTDPEPLPIDHPLWRMENVGISMHLSGRSQTRIGPRACDLFLRNLDRYRRGEPLDNAVDLKVGY